MTDFQGHMFPRNLSVSNSGGGGGTLTSINGDNTAAQTLTTGTAGTDFAITNPGSGSHVFNLPTASASNRGALSSTDWSTFNSKQSALTIGNLTDVGTDGILITGGTGSVIGSGTSFAQHVADATHNGYLASADWNTFNSKIGGSGTAGQVAFFSGTSAITSSSNLLFNNTNGLTNLLPSAFGNIASLGNGIVFDLEQQFTSFSSGATLLELNLELAPTGNTNVFTQAIFAEIQTSATAFNYFSNKGVDVRVNHNGTGIVSEMSGGSFEANNLSTGTVSSMQGIGGGSFQNSSGTVVLNIGIGAYTANAGSGTITTNRSLYIGIVGNNGTITNNYGIFIDNQNTGITNYALFTNLGKVSFGDQVIANALIDLTAIAAGSTVLKITKTNATPATTWTTGATTSNPAGFIQITDVGGTKYIPYYS